MSGSEKYRWLRRSAALAVFAAVTLLGAACGSDDDTNEADDGSSGDDSEAVVQNACPAEGCTIGFASVEAVDGEIEVTWDINFDPDINGNHIHIYWDIYDADQVSNDASERGVDQGEWVPTDASPTYVTDSAVSTASRGESTTLCVVAADRDHNVISSGTEVCQDVSDLL